ARGIASEIAELEARREAFDEEALERDRAEACERALFDPSPEAERARKYEAATERGIYRTLKEFRQVEAEAAATVSEDETYEAPGSFSPGAPVEAPEEELEPAEPPPIPDPPRAPASPSDVEGPRAIPAQPIAAVPIRTEAPAPRPTAFALDPTAARAGTRPR